MRSLDVQEILRIRSASTVPDVMRIVILDERPQVAACVRDALSGMGVIESRRHTLSQDFSGVDVVIYRPPCITPGIADFRRAAIDFIGCAQKQVRRFVLLSSAAIHVPSAHHEGNVSEAHPVSRNAHNRISASWRDLELEAEKIFSKGNTRLVILRSAMLPTADDECLSGLFTRPIALTLPGHDPSIQLLSPKDLADAIRHLIEKDGYGTYHLCPCAPIPLKRALRAAGVFRIPFPRLLQFAALRGLEWLGCSVLPERLDYVRYLWTIGANRLSDELTFSSKRSSLEALQEALDRPRNSPLSRIDFDQFGMDRDYIRAFAQTLLNFLSRYYWRIEVSGGENIPSEGPGVLVGVHRGFMPWDGVMMLHLIMKQTGRVPRFLIHPTLVKFPFLANFMTKLGGVIACRENADYILKRNELLGVYPEGIRGAFTLYYRAYELGRFGRNDFVKMALRNRAPIIPFVTVGSAEIFPILAKVQWRWWQQHTEWPFFPITPTFPLIPLPLPSKWHTQFLSPIHVEKLYGPEAAEDPEIVQAISWEVRSKIQAAIDNMLRRRKSIFFGSVFQDTGLVPRKSNS